jgi:cell division FtsZ-interacting protein ZapD
MLWKSRRLCELQRQAEVLKQWLDTPGIPPDAHQKLNEMIAEVKERINELVVAVSVRASP